MYFSVANPLRQDPPIGVILGCKLPASAMKAVATRLGREWVEQKAACGGIARNYQPGDDLEILPRLLLGPGGASDWQRLQTESIIAPRMAHDTAGVAGTLFQKDWLDACPVILEVKRWTR